MIDKLMKFMNDKKIILDNGCWELEICNGIYLLNGRFQVHKWIYSASAHRLSAYFYLKMDLENGHHLALHKNSCHNKRCWNPDHLYVGTHSSNSMDREELGLHKSLGEKIREKWAEITHCPKGHKYSKRKDGLGRVCKKCNKERSAIWNKKYKERKNATLSKMRQ